MNALQVDNITKRFGNFEAVKDLSFVIPEGTVYGLLGPNGAGKTTTIRMVMNIIIPDSGDIRIRGRRMDDEMMERIGYLPEDRGLYPKMKVGELVLFLAEMKGIRGAEAKKRIDYWLDRFDLADCKMKKVEELSKGMQQKVQYIATVINEPELLILDEPFAGLDPISLDQMKGLILSHREKGNTVVFSTHMMEHAEKLCDYLLLINKGRKVMDGTLEAIRSGYKSNSVVVELEGETGFVEEIPMVAGVTEMGKKLEVELAEGADPQEFLRAVVGRSRVRSFEEKKLSLHEIFVRLVGKN